MSQYPPGYYPPQPPPQLPHSHQLDSIHGKLDEIATDIQGVRRNTAFAEVRLPSVVIAAAWLVFITLGCFWMSVILGFVANILGLMRGWRN